MVSWGDIFFLLQILLRVSDDVTKFEWHPNEDSILVGGCMNGQERNIYHQTHFQMTQ